MELVKVKFECSEHGLIFINQFPKDGVVIWDEKPHCPHCAKKWKMTWGDE